MKMKRSIKIKAAAAFLIFLFLASFIIVIYQIYKP